VPSNASMWLKQEWKILNIYELLNEDNNSQIDLQERIKNANNIYSMLQKFFKNENISKKLKLRLKNTIIDKMLTYASETWTLTKRERESNWMFLKGKCME